MILRVCLLASLAVASVVPSTADSRPRDREQDAAFRETRNGSFVPLRQIESRIVPQMRGYSYLGPELDSSEGRYRLKFMRGPQVVWIDVDARSGHIIGRSGF